MSAKIKIVDELIETLDSKFFKSMAEPARVDIFKCLLLNGRCDISSITEKLPQDRSVISRHLQLMLDADILICDKEGRHTFYDINSSGVLLKLETIVKKVKQCISETGCG